ncbi:MAG: peptidylprolyl isomerase [Cytophagales bacterium]|nr:peptidylprolyl isomerase [Cytophagales bacterium]
MKITKNAVVTIAYNLNKEDEQGETVEVVSADAPFTFLLGADPLLPAFEQNLEGLAKDDEFSFEIKCEEAYGQREEDAIAEVPKSIFDVEVEGKKVLDELTVGIFVPLQDPEGNLMQGLILEIKEEAILIDFNHPMAGFDLFFTGKVLDVRAATEEEIAHGHVHGEDGCSH